MREVQQIERYLLKQLEPSEAILMEAQLLLNTELQEKTKHQSQTYTLAKAYGRKQLRQEIKAVENRLFTENKFKTFRNKIVAIFKL